MANMQMGMMENIAVVSSAVIKGCSETLNGQGYKDPLKFC